MSFPSSLQRVVPQPLNPAAKAVYHKLFRLQLRIRFWCADRRRTPLTEVPVPPALLRFRVGESLAVAEFLRIGEGWAKLIRQHLNAMGIDLDDTGVAGAHRVLDFGCGCGRTSRWFLRDAAIPEFHGVDVDAEAVDWCREHLPRGHFLATAATPPLPYPAEHFDAIYCLSVFTHLDESMQDAWLAELSRILKPGGVLLLTVFAQAASKNLDAAGQKTLQTRGFLQQRSQKLRGLVPDWYQTTWHSREYIVDRLSAWFGDVRYCPVPDSQQDIVAARKAGPAE